MMITSSFRNNFNSYEMYFVCLQNLIAQILNAIN